MKKLTTLAIALVLPLLFVSTPNKATAANADNCMDRLQQLIDATQNNFTGSNAKETKKAQKKLIKKLYDAKKELMKGSAKDQYKAAKKVWEYDWELRKMFFKGKVACDVGAEFDESALQLLICIVDLYFPDSGYDPYANGVISCE